MKKDVKFLIQKPIAHRGLHDDEVAENSLIAFLRAVDAGYPIELDVQLTTDEKLIVFHDWTLDRVTGESGELSEKKYDEIKNLTLGNSNQKILLFQDVLALVDGQVPIIVEIKSKKYFDFKICEETYNLLKNYNGECAVSSFNAFVVRWFKENAKEVVRGQNFTNFGNENFVIAFFKKIFSYITWIFSANNPDFFACRANTLPDAWPARIAKKRNKILLTWKIKSASEYDIIKNIIDNEFFDGKPHRGQSSDI
ncbi:MAG: glycerophosphodiester phosphodiesterase family protein [Patescibacteria group bacterium]